MIKTAQKGFTKHQFKKIVEFRKTGAGFTLIELLVVIAVLGILAAVLLVGIDPLDQMARGRDAGRISSVAQVAHAMQSYSTANREGYFPPINQTWQTTYLVTGGEIKQVVTTSGNTNCVPSTTNQGNYCYSTSGTAVNSNYPNAVIWSFLESKSNKVKAAGPSSSACAAGLAAAVVWDSTQGRSGLACVSLTAAPSAGITLY